jgi:CRISPR system Cascade subunit CasE
VAVFEGVLQISDESLFKAALTNGIGRAKAYGCGLLTLANLT